MTIMTSTFRDRSTIETGWPLDRTDQVQIAALQCISFMIVGNLNTASSLVSDGQF